MCIGIVTLSVFIIFCHSPNTYDCIEIYIQLLLKQRAKSTLFLLVNWKGKARIFVAKTNSVNINFLGAKVNLQCYFSIVMILSKCNITCTQCSGNLAHELKWHWNIRLDMHKTLNLEIRCIVETSS